MLQLAKKECYLKYARIKCAKDVVWEMVRHFNAPAPEQPPTGECTHESHKVSS